MKGYVRPGVVATYSIAELRADAASCGLYLLNASDRTLKSDIEMVEQPLERIRSISTD